VQRSSWSLQGSSEQYGQVIGVVADGDRGRGLLGALLALTEVLLDPANHLGLVFD
jgi:hypothetical protein